MEFIKSNFLDTTTQIAVESNTLTVSKILTRDLTQQYVSEGFNNDLTTTSLTFTLDETTSVSRIAIMGTNLKGFTIFFNGATASTFVLTSADTTASDWSSNSNTSLYLFCNTASVSTITIDAKTTQVADSEKAIGLFVSSDLKLDFDRIPSFKDYKPLITSKEVVHKLSNGDERVNVIDRKLSADVKLKSITEAFRNDLKSLYDERTEFMFVAFGTSTGWDEIFFNTAWQGDFNFFRHTNNNPAAGFDGSIKLRQG